MLNDIRQAAPPAAIDFSRLRMPELLITAGDDRFGPDQKAKLASMTRRFELRLPPVRGAHRQTNVAPQNRTISYRILPWPASFRPLRWHLPHPRSYVRSDLLKSLQPIWLKEPCDNACAVPPVCGAPQR